MRYALKYVSSIIRKKVSFQVTPEKTQSTAGSRRLSVSGGEFQVDGRATAKHRRRLVLQYERFVRQCAANIQLSHLVLCALVA